MSKSNGSAVVGNNVWNFVFANLLLDDLAELEAGFLGVNSVRNELAFDVKEDSEMFVGLLNGYNVHLSEWVSEVSSDLSVNFNEALFVVGDLSSFVSGESILKSLLEEN